MGQKNNCPTCKGQKDTGSYQCRSCYEENSAARTESTARCLSCKNWMPLEQFAPSRKRKNRGVREMCKRCDTAARKKRRQASPERTREQHRARMAVYRAVQRGTLIRAETCEQCGVPGGLQAHHRDYSLPLEVNWLCQKCHLAVHAV